MATLKKIISGGQTGADRGGLLAADALDMPTGGFIPKGFKTELGQEPHLGDRFDLVETKSSRYQPRTRMNIQTADGTALFGRMGSPGSKYTLHVCKQVNSPFIVNPTPSTLHNWIQDLEIEILNIAGNRASKNPGITKRVMDTIIAAVNPDLWNS